MRHLVLLSLILCLSCTQIKFEVGKRKEANTLQNLGIVEAINAKKDYPVPEPFEIARVFGVHVDSTLEIPNVTFSKVESSSTRGVAYSLNEFEGYDGVNIPFYEMLPEGFDSGQKYPTVILFSGHGDMDQVAFEKWTYQKGAGLLLAKEGFVVYVMENRGMGKLSSLGDHLHIDAVARLVGGSWYGELITDGLYLTELVHQKSYVDQSRIGVAGVSTGGALSMLVSAIDSRIKAAYVQGYLGSYKTTFGTRSNHHICNNIPNVLNHFDMAEIAGAIAPRNAMYVNGQQDTFYYQDAEAAFEKVKIYYQNAGAGDKIELASPDDTIHELSEDIMIEFFLETLKP
ncbi:MAG: acetylxylan esterase [Cyclobacteriaceae bacterium]